MLARDVDDLARPPRIDEDAEGEYEEDLPGRDSTAEAIDRACHVGKSPLHLPEPVIGRVVAAVPRHIVVVDPGRLCSLLALLLLHFRLRPQQFPEDLAAGRLRYLGPKADLAVGHFVFSESPEEEGSDLFFRDGLSVAVGSEHDVCAGDFAGAVGGANADYGCIGDGRVKQKSTLRRCQSSEGLEGETLVVYGDAHLKLCWSDLPATNLDELFLAVYDVDFAVLDGCHVTCTKPAVRGE